MSGNTHTKSFRVKARKGGKLLGFAADYNGSRFEGDFNPNGNLIATIFVNEDDRTYGVLNVLGYQEWLEHRPAEEVCSQFEVLSLRNMLMITDQDKVEKKTVPTPISVEKAKEKEEIIREKMGMVSDHITMLKELKAKALTHREKTILWMPCQKISLEKAYQLEVGGKKADLVKPREMIPSLDRVSMYHVNGRNPTHVVAIGYQPMFRKAKRTYKGVVKAEYTISDWQKLHQGEKLTTSGNPLVEHVLFRHPGTPVCLKTTEEVGQSDLKRQRVEDLLDDQAIELAGMLHISATKNQNPLDKEFAEHTPENKASVAFIKDGSWIYLSDAPWISLHGESVEKATKRIGTVAGIDVTEMMTNFKVEHDLTDNVDGLLGYMHPLTFLEYVRTSTSNEMYDYFVGQFKKGKLHCKQFTARVCIGGMLVKGNVEISSKVAEGTLLVLGHSGFCPEIKMQCDDWLHLRVGIKNDKAAVSRSLACFIRGVFGCMAEASETKRKHVKEHTTPEHLHLLVEHLGEGEAEAALLYQELVRLAPSHNWTQAVRALLLNRALSTTRATIEKNLADGKFPIDGSAAGAISVITKWTDTGDVDINWITTELAEKEEGDFGKVFTSVSINGTFFYSREAMGHMHVSLGTCDFDDWFGFIPSNVERSTLLANGGVVTASQFLGVFFRWPQGFREARQSKVWFIGETRERHLHPNVKPWVKAWEPGMTGVKPIVNCQDKLFPSPESVVKKSIPLTKKIEWEALAKHMPVLLIGRFYNALVAVLGNIISTNNGDENKIAAAMEACSNTVLLYSTSDVVDLEKMGVGAEDYQKIVAILNDVKETALVVPAFLANHAAKHVLNDNDDWTTTWNIEAQEWGQILEDIQSEVYKIGETYRASNAYVTSSVIDQKFELRGETSEGTITSEVGHEYSRFLLQKWGSLWINLLNMEKELTEGLDYGSNSKATEEKLHNLAANMRRTIFLEMEKSIDQINHLSEDMQMRIGLGLITEFMLRVGKESEDKSYTSKGGSGWLSSPAAFKLISLGLKPISKIVLEKDMSMFEEVKKGTRTFTARSDKAMKVKTLLQSGAQLLAGEKNVVIDAFSTEKDGKAMMKFILVTGAAR